MSDATERPAPEPGRGGDPDAWAEACAEDLAAEKERWNRQEGREQPGTPAEELRKLADAVADRIGALGALGGPYGTAAQSAVQQMITQARAAVEPVVERNPQVFGHLAAAGSELLAAYRAAVEGTERRWTRGASGDRPDEDPPGPERIDLD